MDYQQYQGDPNFSGNFEQKPPRRSAMETAAFVLSILSILFLSFFQFTLVLIGLSILFALLSKGGKMKISQFAKCSIMTFMDMMITAISLMISMAEHLMNRCLRLIPCRNSRMMWFSGMVNLPAASPVNGLKQGIK